MTFGSGSDRINMQSGTITGAVDQGGGTDFFTIGGGTVAGNVQQGAGIDDFNMSGGQIGSLNQGDGLDTFTMTGGRIVDFFEDGDRAWMTGGRIGRVNMKLDKNYFNMSGGTIDRNLVTGFDQDHHHPVRRGTIGGNISVSGGNDSVTITGGTVGGDVLMSFGADSFVWNGGGIVYGSVDLGGDNDTVASSALTSHQCQSRRHGRNHRWRRHRHASPSTTSSSDGHRQGSELGDDQRHQRHRIDAGWQSGARRQRHRQGSLNVDAREARSTAAAGLQRRDPGLLPLARWPK